jgi:hypothetical protein
MYMGWLQPEPARKPAHGNPYLENPCGLVSSSSTPFNPLKSTDSAGGGNKDDEEPSTVAIPVVSPHVPPLALMSVPAPVRSPPLSTFKVFK